MKKKTLNLIVRILRYLLPAVIGWLEGDTHVIVDSLSGLLSIWF